ncbi:hypothetical protein [[Bacillus] enclensis]|uniref:hypothetical protein n=1 Tax=[Bacillus] enclensis TaxID=1402860 RepID=UPI0018DE4501|nr:hypothetical protein [[Bacillus] enclensis]MBH9965589.1 hypothetical protein [[Bacillus] enclensis]
MMQVTKKVTFRDPGQGAIEYAKTFVVGVSRSEAVTIFRDLKDGNLHDQSDKRVKRCDYCGYFWRDDSLRNTKKTCCDGCKTGIKTLQRRQQRADEELLNPKPRKHTLMDDYVWWLEYPYWANEYSMLKVGWKFEKPSGVALMDYVENSRNVYGDGNSKKSIKHVSYHGDDRDLF